jgi:hypothetical protein
MHNDELHNCTVHQYYLDERWAGNIAHLSD